MRQSFELVFHYHSNEEIYVKTRTEDKKECEALGFYMFCEGVSVRNVDPGERNREDEQWKMLPMSEADLSYLNTIMHENIRACREKIRYFHTEDIVSNALYEIFCDLRKLFHYAADKPEWQKEEQKEADICYRGCKKGYTLTIDKSVRRLLLAKREDVQEDILALLNDHLGMLIRSINEFLEGHYPAGNLPCVEAVKFYMDNRLLECRAV